ncbi:MAG: hypothetical protein HUU38_25365 [Anaerolineales bacterium]|nr:hypothetical protein [Anaerolineales bacterium]
MAISQPPFTIHLITHNHWDREWIFTARYANRWLPTFFNNLFEMLESQPDYRFVLDGQTRIIEDYLDQLPLDEAAARARDIRKYARRGQLMLGPAYLQPDWTLVSGEALVRNLLIGDKTARKYGPVMKVAWLLDNFGQVAQAPQILKGFGIEGVFVWRGVDMPDDQLKSEFWWEAPDGSRVLGIYLLDSYRNAMVLNMTREIAGARIFSLAENLKPFASTPNVLLMNGYEQVPHPDDVLSILAEIGPDLPAGTVCRQSTPPEYLAAIRGFNPTLPTIGGYLYSGRFAPILKGVFSSRNPLKQQNNDCQRELERWAEKFNSFAWAFGFDYPEDRFENAWKTLLLNHTHDDVCGCCIDPIARDMETRFAEVQRAATIMSSESLRALAQTVDTSHRDGAIRDGTIKDEASRDGAIRDGAIRDGAIRDGIAILIFNPSSRARQEVLGLSFEIPEEVTDFHFRDRHGNVHPHQLLSRIGRKVDLYLWAGKVPSVGYKTVYVIPHPAQAGNETVTPSVSAREHQMENDFLRVTIHADGTLKLFDKTTHHTFENLGYLEDGGDCGDTYDYSFPREDTLISSRGRSARITLETAGPLLARFRVETSLPLPAHLTADRERRDSRTCLVPVLTFVELTANARHVEIHTTVHNIVKDHRLRVLFPTGIQTDHSQAGMPFDIATFPLTDGEAPFRIPEMFKGVMLAGRYTAPVNTRPFRHFITLTDEQRGLSIFSRGLMEYEVLPQEHTIALTLLRSVGWLARNDLATRIGDVGPHIFTPEAQCLGTHTFDYAIFPHGPDVQKANPAYQADRHTLKFRAVQTNHHPGRLPDEYSFLSWVAEKPKGAFKLNALKKSEDGEGLIVRLFNKLEVPATGHVKIGGQISKAWRTNLNEELADELSVEDGTVRFRAKGKEIVTIKVQLQPWRLIDDFQIFTSRILSPPTLDEKMGAMDTPVILTEDEVGHEQARAQRLHEELQAIRSQAYLLNEQLERIAAPSASQLAELHRLKGQEATLARQGHEARISALLNQQLFVTLQMERELGTLGEELNWARVRKRVGEFLIHYYEGLG